MWIWRKKLKNPYIKACYTGENYREIHVPPNWIQRAHKILPPDVTFKENALTEPIQWQVEPVRDAQEDSSGSSFLAQEHIQLLGCGS